ncbi:MAG: hypothetical protein BGO98_44345 [Myxococcales bacterium 68-20]|nr:MAG: hypothetical protein BGO98_44345 [Myxococcales bacterium 68-20]
MNAFRAEAFSGRARSDFLLADAIGRADVAGDGARDGDRSTGDVGLDRAAVLDAHGVLRDEPAADGGPERRRPRRS